jgi:CelD/BcsL family acetyltransferase involved in cellulose biosynthesis
MAAPGGVRRVLDAAVDRASESRPLYLFGYLVGDALVSVALFVLGRRLTR